MPMHDWTRVNAGIYHDFHNEWTLAIKRSLNNGLLPKDYYALTEQPAGPFVPDVIALQKPVGMNGTLPDTGPGGGVLLAEAPPRVRFHAEVIDADVYARRARQVTIRHVSEHEVIAMIEIVSPGNKDSIYKFRAFVEKSATLIWHGIHLVVIDPFPPTPRDPQGIHKAIGSSSPATTISRCRPTLRSRWRVIGLEMCPKPSSSRQPSAPPSSICLYF